MFEKLKPHKDKIIFQFMDKTTNGMFQSESEQGLTIQTNETNQMHTPRWAKIVTAGSDVDGAKDGSYILIEPLKWTQGFEFGSEMFWATSKDQIICYSDEKPSQYK